MATYLEIEIASLKKQLLHLGAAVEENLRHSIDQGDGKDTKQHRQGT